MKIRKIYYLLIIIILSSCTNLLPPGSENQADAVASDQAKDGDNNDQQLPDLSISTIKAASSGQIGTMLSVELEISNQGLADGQDISLNVYLSADEAITTEDILLATYANVKLSRSTQNEGETLQLAAGQSLKISGQIYLDASIPLGDYFLAAVVDPANTIEELDEKNNISEIITFSVMPREQIESQLVADRLPSVDQPLQDTSSAIEVAFKEPLKPQTVTEQSFLVLDTNNQPVDGLVSYDQTNNTVMFTPTEPLAENSDYSIQLTSDMQTASGESIKPESWSFSTQKQFSINISVSGRLAGEITVANNGSDSLIIDKDGDYTFSQLIAPGEGYDITVTDQPEAEQCEVENGNGTVSDSNITNISIVCSKASALYSIGGMVSGLTGKLQLSNDLDLLDIDADGEFSFAKKLPSGQSYLVKIDSKPQDQQCSITNGKGNINTAAITDITVKCQSITVDTSNYSIGGSVNGLMGELTIANNGEELVINQDGAFTFTSKLQSSLSYQVTIVKYPTGQDCQINNGFGEVTDANVSDIAINCVSLDSNGNPVYYIGFNVSGLNGAMKIGSSGVTSLTVNENGFFQFDPPLSSSSGYDLFIVYQPLNQHCTISNGKGTISDANVNDINIDCIQLYGMGGTVTGLDGSLTLQNGDQTETINNDGSFSFNQKYPEGESFSISVASKPDWQECDITGGTGVMPNANVTNIAIDCHDLTSATGFQIGGQISGITGSDDLKLYADSELVETLTLNQDGAFSFNKLLPDAASYNVQLDQDSSSDHCTFSNNLGTVSGSNVTDIEVSCGSKPDLAFSSVQFPVVSKLIPKETTAVNVTIENTGQYPASSLWVDVYLSEDTLLDDSVDINIANHYLTDLLANSSQEVSVNITPPADTPSGDYYLLFDSRVSRFPYEYNTENNMQASSQTYNVTNQLPDIKLDSFSIPSSELTTGETVTASYTISNPRSYDLSDSFNIHFYIFDDNSYVQSDYADLLDTITISGLASGASISDTIELNIIPGQAGKYLWMIIDNDNAITEFDEFNNEQVITVPISFPGTTTYYIQTLNNESFCNDLYFRLEGDTIVYVYDATGTMLLAQNDDNDYDTYSTVEVPLESGKSYLFKVTGASVAFLYRYAIIWGAAPYAGWPSVGEETCPDSYEDGDDTSTGARTLAIDIMEDHTLDKGDEDWFRITVP